MWHTSFAHLVTSHKQIPKSKICHEQINNTDINIIYVYLDVVEFIHIVLTSGAGGVQDPKPNEKMMSKMLHTWMIFGAPRAPRGLSSKAKMLTRMRSAF